MTIQEKRWMDMDNLRALCIRHGWFTRGDCKAYDKFLNMPYDAKGTQRNITTKLLYSLFFRTTTASTERLRRFAIAGIDMTPH